MIRGRAARSRSPHEPVTSSGMSRRGRPRDRRLTGRSRVSGFTRRVLVGASVFDGAVSDVGSCVCSALGKRGRLTVRFAAHSSSTHWMTCAVTKIQPLPYFVAGSLPRSASSSTWLFVQRRSSATRSAPMINGSCVWAIPTPSIVARVSLVGRSILHISTVFYSRRRGYPKGLQAKRPESRFVCPRVRG